MVKNNDFRGKDHFAGPAWADSAHHLFLAYSAYLPLFATTPSIKSRESEKIFLLHKITRSSWLPIRPLPTRLIAICPYSLALTAHCLVVVRFNFLLSVRNPIGRLWLDFFSRIALKSVPLVWLVYLLYSFFSCLYCMGITIGDEQCSYLLHSLSDSISLFFILIVSVLMPPALTSVRTFSLKRMPRVYCHLVNFTIFVAF